MCEHLRTCVHTRIMRICTDHHDSGLIHYPVRIRCECEWSYACHSYSTEIVLYETNNVLLSQRVDERNPPCNLKIVADRFNYESLPQFLETMWGAALVSADKASDTVCFTSNTHTLLQLLAIRLLAQPHWTTCHDLATSAIEICIRAHSHLHGCSRFYGMCDVTDASTCPLVPHIYAWHLTTIRSDVLTQVRRTYIHQRHIYWNT